MKVVQFILCLKMGQGCLIMTFLRQKWEQIRFLAHFFKFAESGHFETVLIFLVGLKGTSGTPAGLNSLLEL